MQTFESTQSLPGDSDEEAVECVVDFAVGNRSRSAAAHSVAELVGGDCAVFELCKRTLLGVKTQHFVSVGNADCLKGCHTILAADVHYHAAQVE